MRGILGEFSHLSSKFDYLFSKLGIFLDKSFVGFEKFGNVSLIEFFSLRCQFLPSNHWLLLLSGEHGPPLEKTGIMQLELQLVMCYR